MAGAHRRARRGGRSRGRRRPRRRCPTTPVAGRCSTSPGAGRRPTWPGSSAGCASSTWREARFLEAQLLLAHDHAAEALEVLEAAAAGDFREPYLLPGLLLARLGQLRDLAGKRDRALQAYRGALALAWLPAEAREAAEAGMRAPFARPAADEADPT